MSSCAYVSGASVGRKGKGRTSGCRAELVLQVVDDEGVGREGAQPLLLRVDDGRDTLGRRAELRRREPIEAEVGPREGQPVEERAHGARRRYSGKRRR